MGHINTTATLNINGSYSQEKQLMIKDLIYKNDVDIIFLQEMVKECPGKNPGYTALYNIDTEKLGTAIITRDSLSVTNPEKLPNGRGMACRYHHTLLVKFYEPSRNTRRQATSSSIMTLYIYFDTLHSIVSSAATSVVSHHH